MQSRTSSLIVGALLLSAAGCAAPVWQPPPPQAAGARQTAAGASPAASPAEGPAPEEVTFPGNGLLLGGFLYRPPGPGPFPAIVYLHGSERRPGRRSDLAQVFTRNGLVFFFPHRRGHGRSPGPYLVDRHQALPAAEREAGLVDLLLMQVDDVESAVLFLRQRREVDAARIAIGGCSFGGIETVLAAERSLGLRAGLDFAGAAITWAGNAPLRARMQAAVRRATMPLFFLQAENDFNTEPSRVLAREMERAGRPHRMRIYPPRGTTPMEGHSFCVAEDGVRTWEPDVMAFLRERLR